MPDTSAKRSPSVVGVILAGGLGRRMGGGDKPSRAIGGRPMLARVVDRLAPQVASLVINANGDPARFAAYQLPVVADTIGGFAGPLAGILAGLRWAGAEVPKARSVVSVAADTPFFPQDLAARLTLAARLALADDDADCVVLAASSGGTHPVFGLWPVRLADELDAFLRRGESGKILAFVDRHRRVEARFDDVRLADGRSLDPFFNVNTPDDAAEAEAIAAALDGAAG